MANSFYQINTGCGGIFTLPIPGTQASRIGTFGLITCVGIYVPLTYNKSFAAHIFARIDEYGETDQMFVPTKDQGNKLQEKLLQLLETRLRPHMPTTEDEMQTLRDETVVACPQQFCDEKPTVGWYNVQALQRFFQGQLQVEGEAGGFVVKHGTDEKRFYEYNDKPEWERYNSYEEMAGQKRDWWVVLKDGEWRKWPCGDC